MIEYVGDEATLEALVCRMWDTRTKLLKYVEHTVIEPRDGWTTGAHICLMCDTIQDFLEGDGHEQTLIITMPPRHMKSTVVSNALPAWWLSNHPQGEIIMASYSLNLARNNARACRDLFESEWHRRCWPSLRFCVDTADSFQLEGKANGRPNLIAAGTGGSITGSGADIFIIDDPVKDALEAESVTYRDRVYAWYKMVVESRLSPGGKKIICMTRWHHEDLVGCILRDDPDSCRVLHMPAIDEDGHALWPERYDVPALERKRAVLGGRSFEAQYQGRPTPLEGGLIKGAWIRRGPHMGPDAVRCRYWDKAATHGGGDWTVGCLMAMEDGQYCIEDIIRIQGSPAEVQETIRRTAESDGVEVRIRMEQEGGSAGVEVIDTYARRILLGFDFRGDKPTGAKEVRAGPMIAALENGNLWISDAHWNRELIEEFTQFPLGAHDDQVDACSGAFRELSAVGASDGVWLF